MAVCLTIEKMYRKHKAENPDSQIGKRAIRNAVRTGELKALRVGNRTLIEKTNFEKWLRGELNG